MVAAGSRDPLACRDQTRAAALLAELWRGPVTVATLGGIGRRPEDVVTPECAVSPYLLADGHFADRLRESCARANPVAGVLGPDGAVRDLVVRRFREAVREVSPSAVA
jgi:hypothetical protein